LTKSALLKNNHRYLININIKTCDVLEQLQTFLVTCWKKIHSKIPLHEEIKMTTKGHTILGSFVIVG